MEPGSSPTVPELAGCLVVLEGRLATPRAQVLEPPRRQRNTVLVGGSLGQSQVQSQEGSQELGDSLEVLAQVGQQQLQQRLKQRPRLQHMVLEPCLVLVLVLAAFLEWPLESLLVQESEESVRRQRLRLLPRQPNTVRSQELVSVASQAWEAFLACPALVAFQVWLQVSVVCLAIQLCQELGRQRLLRLQRRQRRQRHMGLGWHLAMEQLLVWPLEEWPPELWHLELWHLEH